MSLYTTDSSTGNDSVERLLSSLTAQAQDVQESLEKFVADRADVLHNQKKAIAEYEAEMFLIEMGEPKQEPEHYVDPNIMKHLSVDKDSDYVKNLSRSIFIQDNNPAIVDGKAAALDYSLLEKKRDMEFDNRPPPSFNEKKKIRETMFLVLDESTIEETRLELAYEEARECGDERKASELADALYFLQRMNADRLTELISEYKPEPFSSKAWGSDPEYAQMMRQLNMISEPMEDISLNGSTGSGMAAAGKKKKNKK